MKKMVSAVLLLVFVSLLLCACGGSGNPLVGNWTFQGGDGPNAYFYTITIRADGTGVINGESMSWSTSGGSLILQSSRWGQLNYRYSVSGNTLTLDGGVIYTK